MPSTAALPAVTSEVAGVAKLPADCQDHDDGAVEDIDVIDYLPNAVPITGPELDAIETYLGRLVDQLLVSSIPSGPSKNITASLKRGNAVTTSCPRP